MVRKRRDPERHQRDAIAIDGAAAAAIFFFSYLVLFFFIIIVVVVDVERVLVQVEVGWLLFISG